MIPYYFNNNFNEILKRKTILENQDYIADYELVHFKQLINNYGIVIDDRIYRGFPTKYAITKEVDKWLDFEYPDIESYDDLQECRFEPNLLNQMYDELKKKSNIKEKHKQVKAEEIIITEKLPLDKWVVITSIPLGIVILVTYLANL